MPAAQSRTLGAKTALIAGGDGPQWYRGHFGKGDAATSPIDIGRTFVSFGVSRVLVGHAIIETVTPLYGGKVIAVQGYPHRDETTGAPARRRSKAHRARAAAAPQKAELICGACPAWP
ncbi:hypothetical protein P1X14_03305 [Sphingomonas sp. AOB5]|uniref:hypothetical protein n=1 Tax=Sphingomonas sp. AOB5 TaxID=3034017 RepID=UPI0023F7275B|nr:hypothetical protein [Sphingomonas sp. AOB5]MDF7774265.1 hypothetical protein [Sphingomonas sp. AOB5]